MVYLVLVIVNCKAVRRLFFISYFQAYVVRSALIEHITHLQGCHMRKDAK